MIDRNQIPSSWEIVKLGEVCENIKSGYPCGNHNSTGIGYLHFRPFNININGTVDLSLSKFVPLKSNEYFLKEGDVIFNNTNSPELLGKTCFIRKANSWVYSNHMTRIRVKEYVNPEYCASYLHYLFYKGYYRLHCSNHVNQASISSSFLNKFVEIPLPPIPEQQRIVSKIEELFSELDKGVESLKTAQQQLKVYRQAVLKWAFEGKLTNENVKGGELPEGWKWVKLGEIAEVKRGKSKHRPRDDKKLFGGEYPFIQTGEIRAAKGGIVNRFTQTYSEIGLQQSKLWPKGTLCLTIAANIAETAFLGFDACFPDSVVGISTNENILELKYINYFIQKLKKEIESKASATAQKNINVEFLENLEIPFCELSEQHQTVQEIETRLSVGDKLEETITTALQQSEALRQSILKKAFEGKLVEQNSNDEPASKLLESIKAEKAAEQRNKRRALPRSRSRTGVVGSWRGINHPCSSSDTFGCSP